MSVKFEKETIKQTGGTAGSVLKGKHDLADEIGTALTGGKGNIGAKGYLAVSDEALAQYGDAVLTIVPIGLS